MRHARLGALATAGALCLPGAYGCTLVVDQTKHQCETKEDCSTLLGANAPFVCENFFCVSPACSVDADCAQSGFTSAICGGDGRCQSGCVSDDECPSGNLCVPSTHRCRVRECSDDATCQNLKQSATAMCTEGACTDATWGCIGKPDDRPAPTMPTATLKFAFYDAILQVPVPATAVACPDPVLFGAACDTPLAGVKAVQDEATGVFTVTGLSQNTYFRLMITPKPPNQDNLRVVDYYSMMTVRDVTEAPAAVTTVADAYLRAAGSSYKPGVTIDGAMGGLFSQAFDCQNKPAKGFSLQIMMAYQSPKFTNPDDLPNYSPTVISYFANNQPAPLTATSTDSSGLVSVVNLPAGSNVPLESYANGRKLPTVNVQLVASHITTVHFFPREYTRTSALR